TTVGGAQAEEGVEEGGGARDTITRVEMKLVQPGSESGSEAGLSNDIAALVLRRQFDRRKAVGYLTLIGLLIFTTAFLLGYVSFRRMCHFCSEEGELVPMYDTAGQDHSSGGSIMYLGELKEMLKKYLKEEKIENTVRRMSRMPHPPGSSEGYALASEILHNFQKLHMDHIWADSHYATLQFPSRTQRNALWMVDAEGVELEEISLDSADYCAYSAMGTATGGVVYVNYARQEDFKHLHTLGVVLNGSVAMARVGGGVSFAEKVWHAQEAGLVGVLIYPDPADIPQDPRRLGLHSNIAVSEHVHLGSGDPFTPGFPSFNHTQFPPTQSSGLPLIPAQPISANIASKLLSQLVGEACPRGWQGRLPYVQCVLGPGFSGPDGRRVKMDVYNRMSPVLINNVFASIEGKIEPDQYVILGAQRDSWGPGAVKSGVGTAILLELARTFSAMVQNGTHTHTLARTFSAILQNTHTFIGWCLCAGFQPRRSLLFVSWDAGDFGNVGATEWLEGYLSLLHLKAVAYFSLDQAVMGDDTLSAYTSPLLVDLIEGALKQVCVFYTLSICVEHPKHTGRSILSLLEAQGSWRSRMVKPLYLNSGAYSFTAFGGVPAMELRFHEEGRVYPFVNTQLDSVGRLQDLLQGRLGEVCRALGELVALMVLRLTHDSILPLDVTSYSTSALRLSSQLNQLSAELQVRGLSPQWVYSARGDYSRAAKTLQEAIKNTDVQDERMTRLYNTRIMR
ncbi:hypothetical protein P4O66_020759, partial [Electrophorus voltai]